MGKFKRNKKVNKPQKKTELVTREELIEESLNDMIFKCYHFGTK